MMIRKELKQRLKEEGNETVTNCHGLKMKAPEENKIQKPLQRIKND